MKWNKLDHHNLKGMDRLAHLLLCCKSERVDSVALVSHFLYEGKSLYHFLNQKLLLCQAYHLVDLLLSTLFNNLNQVIAQFVLIGRAFLSDRRQNCAVFSFPTSQLSRFSIQLVFVTLSLGHPEFLFEQFSVIESQFLLLLPVKNLFQLLQVSRVHSLTQIFVTVSWNSFRIWLLFRAEWVVLWTAWNLHFGIFLFAERSKTFVRTLWTVVLGTFVAELWTAVVAVVVFGIFHFIVGHFLRLFFYWSRLYIMNLEQVLLIRRKGKTGLIIAFDFAWQTLLANLCLLKIAFVLPFWRYSILIWWNFGASITEGIAPDAFILNRRSEFIGSLFALIYFKLILWVHCSLLGASHFFVAERQIVWAGRVFLWSGMGIGFVEVFELLSFEFDWPVHEFLQKFLFLLIFKFSQTPSFWYIQWLLQFLGLNWWLQWACFLLLEGFFLRVKFNLICEWRLVKGQSQKAHHLMVTEGHDLVEATDHFLALFLGEVAFLHIDEGKVQIWVRLL